MGKTGTGLCCVEGRYRRTIGKFVNASGKVGPKKFLLGTDLRAAELANLRLEHLWADVVRLRQAQELERAGVYRQWAKEGLAVHPPSTPAKPTGPLWTEESLVAAEAIRTGAAQVVVPFPEYEGITDRDYDQYIGTFRKHYPSVSFTPGDPVAYARGQGTYTVDAVQFAKQSAEAARIADAAIFTLAGQSVYQAFDAYSAWVRENKIRDGKLTTWGRILAEQVLRLKNATPDLQLVVGM